MRNTAWVKWAKMRSERAKGPPPAESKRLEEEWTVKQTHLKAFNHLTLPPALTWADSNTRAGHTSGLPGTPVRATVRYTWRVGWCMVWCLRYSVMPQYGYATDVFPAPDSDGGGKMSTGA